MAIATPGQQVLFPPREINQLLSYLLLVAMDPGDSRVAWNGKTVHIKSSAETTIAISEIQVPCVGVALFPGPCPALVTCSESLGMRLAWVYRYHGLYSIAIASENPCE